MPQAHIGSELANFLSHFMFSTRLYSFHTLVIYYLRHISVTVRFLRLYGKPQLALLVMPFRGRDT